MRDFVTTALDAVGLSAATYGAFQYDPTLGWFALATAVLYVSWSYAK